MIRFKFFIGDVNWQDYGGSFISKRLNNGEFDYWLVIKVANWLKLVGEREAPAKYCVSLLSVSIDEAGEENLRQSLAACGVDSTDVIEEVKIDSLLSYGVYARLWEGNGNNIQKLMKEARNQAQLAGMLYGFYMDRQLNPIGNTGWDFQKGNIGFQFV